MVQDIQLKLNDDVQFRLQKLKAKFLLESNKFIKDDDFIIALINKEYDEVFEYEIKTPTQKEFSSNIENPSEQNIEQETQKINKQQSKAPDTIKIGNIEFYTIYGASKYLGGMATAKIEKICRVYNLERPKQGYMYLYTKEVLDQVAQIALNKNSKQTNEAKTTLPPKKRIISEEHRRKLQFNAAYAREVKKEKLANTLQN